MEKVTGVQGLNLRPLIAARGKFQMWEGESSRADMIVLENSKFLRGTIRGYIPRKLHQFHLWF